MKFYFFAFYLVLFAFSAQAKSLNDEAAYPKEYMEINWEKELKLNPFQNEKINTINQKTKEQMNILQMQIETLQYEMLALTENNNKQIREILDGKQKVLFDKMRIKYNKEHHINEEIARPSRKKMNLQ
ncbi:MAG: hypothetical protein IKN67_05825 [Alphaproteobacteria bacterium]|nr:hypothetical protein [Alphaproteobacteria bacterium]